MINKINDLKKHVGKKYKMFWENTENLYQGCFFPVYFVFPHLPKYPLYAENMADNWDYGIDLIKKHCEEILKEDIQLGDMLVTKFRKELHVAMYIGKGKIIHVFKDHSLQIDKVDFFKERLVKWFRIKNVL